MKNLQNLWIIIIILDNQVKDQIFFDNIYKEGNEPNCLVNYNIISHESCLVSDLTNIEYI